MKRFTLWMTAALLLMTVGCNEQLDIVEPTVIGSEEEPVVVTGEDMVFKAATVATKSAFKDATSDELVWEASDHLRIYAGSGGTVFQTDATDAPVIDANDPALATFTPSSTGKKKTDQWVATSGGGSIDFYAYYPTGNEAEPAGLNNTVTLRIPSAQEHTATTDFGAYHICYADAHLSRSAVLSGESPSFSFIPLTSLLRVSLKLDENITRTWGEGSLSITDIRARVRGTDVIAGDVTLNMTTGEFESIANGSSTVEVAYTSGAPTLSTAQDSAVINLVLLPFPVEGDNFELEIWAKGEANGQAYLLNPSGGSRVSLPRRATDGTETSYKGGFQYSVPFAIANVVEYNGESETEFKEGIEDNPLVFTIDDPNDTTVTFPDSWYIQAYSFDTTAAWIPVPQGSDVTSYTIPDASGNSFVTISYPEGNTSSHDAHIVLSPNISEVKVLANGRPATDLQTATPVSGYNLADTTSTGYTIRSTANCYVVNAPGTYRFPLVYGNGYTNGIVNTAALAVGGYTDPIISVNSTAPVIAWQDPDASDLLTDLSITRQTTTTSGGTAIGSVQWVEFTVEPGNIREANVLLVVPTANGSTTAAWSWHIWITPFRLASVTTPGDFIPFNLGWVSTESVVAYPGRKVYLKMAQRDGWGTATKVVEQQEAMEAGSGDPSQIGFSPYYQFGRKDPMPASSGNLSAQDGELVVSRIVYPNNNSFSWRTGSAGWTLSGSKNTVVSNALRTGVANPCIFYTDWNRRPNSQTYLWCVGGTSASTTTVKTVFDPSPAGYCVPPTGSFAGGTSVVSTIQRTGPSGSQTETTGVKWTTASGKTYFFPFLGFRLNLTGELSFVQNAYSILSTVSTTDDRSEIAYTTTTQGTTHRQSGYTFGIAAPVNPIRE